MAERHRAVRVRVVPAAVSLDGEEDPVDLLTGVRVDSDPNLEPVRERRGGEQCHSGERRAAADRVERWDLLHLAEEQRARRLPLGTSFFCASP